MTVIVFSDNFPPVFSVPSISEFNKHLGNNLITIYDQLSKAVAEATPREVQPRVSSPSHQPTQGHRVRDAVIIGVVVGVDVEVGDGVDDDDHQHHHHHHHLRHHHDRI